MKTPLGPEVGFGPGHIVLNGVPALRERGKVVLGPGDFVFGAGTQLSPEKRARTPPPNF